MLSVDQTSGLYGSQPPISSVQPTVNMVQPAAAPLHKHIWIVTGPAGCGKSTVAKHIADELQAPYIEGDEV
jgi:gluconokinase